MYDKEVNTTDSPLHHKYLEFVRFKCCLTRVCYDQENSE